MVVVEGGNVFKIPKSDITATVGSADLLKQKRHQTMPSNQRMHVGDFAIIEDIRTLVNSVVIK